jgi:hypothetical protein
MAFEKCSKCGSERIWSGEERVILKGVVEFGIGNFKTINTFFFLFYDKTC